MHRERFSSKLFEVHAPPKTLFQSNVLMKAEPVFTNVLNAVPFSPPTDFTTKSTV